jgi:hypothetical protein
MDDYSWERVMIEALILMAGLSSGTLAPSPVRRRQQRVLVSSLGLSETPLPETLGPTSLRQVPTLGTTADRRSVLSQVEALQKHKEAVSVLPINDDDEAFVSQIIAENRPKATSKRLLTRFR